MGDLIHSLGSLVYLDANIVVYAADIRAKTNLKLPDAIHVATARSLGCKTLLTNDQVLCPITAPQVRLLSETSK